MPKLISLPFVNLYCHEERKLCNSSSLHPEEIYFDFKKIKRKNRNKRFSVCHFLESDFAVFFKKMEKSNPKKFKWCTEQRLFLFFPLNSLKIKIHLLPLRTSEKMETQFYIDGIHLKWPYCCQNPNLTLTSTQRLGLTWKWLCKPHPPPTTQTFQALLDELESWNLAQALTRPIWLS